MKKYPRKQRKLVYDRYMSCGRYRKGCDHMDEISKIKNIDLIIEAVAVMIGDFERHRKKAAYLILKACLTDEFFKHLMEDEQLKPVAESLKK